MLEDGKQKLENLADQKPKSEFKPLKILVVVPNFIPEIGSAAHIYYDLSKCFVNRGHEVDVITTYPRGHYLSENSIDPNIPLDEVIDGINIHRCKYPVIRDNIVIRGLEHFIIPRLYFKKYLEIGRKFDLSLIYIPPLPLYYFAKKIKKYDGTPSILNYQDFHPQELIDVGIIRNPLVRRIMEHIERQSYKNSDYITVLTEGGIEFVTQRGADPKKVCHIYNAVNLNDINSHQTTNDFKKEEGIEDKFLISYAGILSYFQNVDQILEVAKELKEYNDIVFCIVGDGNSKEILEHKISKEQINNVRLLPLQSRDKYYDIIKSSDISLLSLDSRMQAPCLPGKTINLMACGKPIIALVPENSETAIILKRVQCAVVVNPGDIEGMRSAILRLKDNASAREAMGNNGRRYLEQNMNVEKSVSIYEEIFRALTENKDLAERSISSSSKNTFGGMNSHGT
jgi:colanic acid biosynthesis glycosyl transferase WcaI